MNKRKIPPHGSRHGHRQPGRETVPAGDSPRPTASAEAGWLFGLHAVGAALANPARRCHRLLATRQGEEGLGDVPAGHRLKTQIVDKREIDRLLPAGAVHQGVALLADPPPEPDIEDILAGAGDRATLVILDQATDPRNIGAVLRAAAAFDAAAVIMPERHAPATTGVLAKAASGALETVPLVRITNLARAIERIKEAGFWCVGLDGDGTMALSEADLSGRLALVLGAEGAGLRRLTREHCDLVVRIPISARIESLNLATAAAIALYEVARRTP
ncbi:MAG: 23S rRNA (guanosine(2251)-2'-O)-methyltransferase RlmB [Rhodospirillales bacterium]|nr:23S rRNA (guanosine(2251)-2'-O)-methyltransferase RlmB [Rhodospirillales bacterium]